MTACATTLMRSATCAALLTAASCTAKPVPYSIERGGSLPVETYEAMARAAALAPPVTLSGPPDKLPEPAWACVFQPGFMPREAPLRVAAFKSDGSERAAAVATELAGALGSALGPLFAPSSPSVWQGGEDEFVLSGTVTRADEQGKGKDEMAATQVEAVLMRHGMIIGAVQVNAVQPPGREVVPLKESSTAHESRARYVASEVRIAFERAASGADAAVSPAAVRYLFPAAPNS